MSSVGQTECSSESSKDLTEEESESDDSDIDKDNLDDLVEALHNAIQQKVSCRRSTM